MHARSSRERCEPCTQIQTRLFELMFSDRQWPHHCISSVTQRWISSMQYHYLYLFVLLLRQNRVAFRLSDRLSLKCTFATCYNFPRVLRRLIHSIWYKLTIAKEHVRLHILLPITAIPKGHPFARLQVRVAEAEFSVRLVFRNEQ